MSDYAFPFVGAGEASYFEWAELFVCFERAPSAAEAQAIAKRVPPPLRDTIDWKGPLLWVASEQGVGRLIKAAYGKKKKAPTKLTTQSKFASAPATAYQRFNADIEAWLEAAHRHVPIRVAYRHEDLEAGGTQLSDWHRASVTKLPKVLAELAREDAMAIGPLGVRLARAAEVAEIVVKPAVVKKFTDAVEAQKQAEAEAREAKWSARKNAATKELGAAQPPYAKKRSLEDVEPGLVKLEKVLPATARRLRRMAKGAGLTVRKPASAKGIAAVEAKLGAKLTKEHRALLAVFDGGQIGDVVILGTAVGGAKGDAEIATFSNAWSGEEGRWTALAHSWRDRVIVGERDKVGKMFMLEGTPGFGGGTITRVCKTLDLALDLALKAGRVLSNKAGG